MYCITCLFVSLVLLYHVTTQISCHYVPLRSYPVIPLVCYKPIALLPCCGTALTYSQDEQDSGSESGSPYSEDDDEATSGSDTEDGDEDVMEHEPELPPSTPALQITSSAAIKSERIYKVLKGSGLGSLPSIVIENGEIDVVNLLLRISAITDDNAVEVQKFRTQLQHDKETGALSKSIILINGFLDKENATEWNTHDPALDPPMGGLCQGHLEAWERHDR